MFPRRRSVLTALMLCGGAALCLLLFLQDDEKEGVNSAAPTGQTASRDLKLSGEGEGGGAGAEEGGGGLHRHLLLNTMSTPYQLNKPHTSFIRLQGVDSSGNDLFLVHGASLEQLKALCAALEECEGFNSEGWMKSRVAGKKRATIDLYLKQVAVAGATLKGQEVLRDEASGVFSDLLREYGEMEQQLKIYIYQTEIGQDIPSLEDYKYGVEYLFISLLAKSKFRTMNPEEATLYFIPSRCTAYRKSVPALTPGIERAASITRDMVSHLRTEHPYWNRTLGADHFYICAHDMGTEVSKSADVGLWKNAIGLVNTADYSEQYFVPHKDISVPPHPGRGVVDWATMGQGGATFDPYQRVKLAFLAGNEHRGPVRPLLYQQYESDPDFLMVKGHILEEDYIKALKTSKFCLCPRGHKGWSPRVMDALWFGCIPVFLADHYVPPLYDLIPWQTISLAVLESQVPSLKLILQSISNQQIATMQSNILKVYRHLTWNDPPQPYDAFHGVLFQLWQRRHVRRTQSYPLKDLE